MYKEIQDYFVKRGKSELLKSCIERIHYVENGIEFHCGYDRNNATLVLSIIEEGICDGELDKLSEATMENGKGLTVRIIIQRTKEGE